jgi:hypothetical protein
VNLVAKVILHQFNASKGQGEGNRWMEDEQADDETDLKLIDLANNADNEESKSEDPEGGHSNVDIKDKLTEMEGVIRE